MVSAFNACHDACEEARDAEDYVTVDLLTSNARHLDKCIEKLSAKLAKRQVIGDQLWLDRLI